VIGLDATLRALADPTRRDVIDLLRKKPRRAGDLAEALRASAPAMSRHLRILRKSGLIEASREEDKRVRMYQLRVDAFATLRRWLDQVEAYWTDQLASFKRHAEKRR
jgi:DNA-binding transcriptional ArsR family regulator